MYAGGAGPLVRATAQHKRYRAHLCCWATVPRVLPSFRLSAGGFPFLRPLVMGYAPSLILVCQQGLSVGFPSGFHGWVRPSFTITACVLTPAQDHAQPCVALPAYWLGVYGSSGTIANALSGRSALVFLPQKPPRKL